MMTVPPAGMVGAATATEQARARGQQRLDDHLKTQAPEANTSAGVRHASPSALGAELSDDSLTMSPEQHVLHKRWALKRDARARLPSGKRSALSLLRPTRGDSPSTHDARERSPRLRGPKSLEERVLTAELQGAFYRSEIKAIRDELDGHLKIGLDLRREVFGSQLTDRGRRRAGGDRK